MDVLRASSMNRSRGGCWTCKRRHKKCGEERPVCQRCAKADIACEGYDVRLNWAMSSAATSATGAGVASPPDAQAQTRSQKKARRRNRGTGGHDDGATSSARPAAPDQLDLLCLQSWPAGQPGIESLPGEDVSKGLMDEFIASGHQTLTGRSGKETLFMSDVLPLCEECPPLRHACIAYQASLRTDTSRWAPVYMQSALSRYVDDLNLPEKMSVNSTLATGVLLCSVSINSLYVWTPLLTGLHGVLQQRGLLAAPRDDPLACHLLEVVSLMDMPCFTINRLSPSLNLWKFYVAPGAPSGIEQTSGLPYSLITLLADVGSPCAEEALLRWPGELGEDFIQIHLWDAFRYAGVLHHRALCPATVAEAAGVRSTTDGPASADILRMRVLASVQAIIDSGAFTFRQPLARAILYPLFIAGVLADASVERQVCRVALQHIINIGQQGPETVVADILTRIWTEGNGLDHTARLEMCVRFVAELNAEIHLY